MKKGFTIVEILVVVAIIGILLGIVTTAATSSVKNARVRRADAMCRALEQAISAYYAQEGKWPDRIETRLENGMGNKTKYTFSGGEADEIFQQIVDKSFGANATRPLVDATALFVAKAKSLNRDGCFDNHSDRTSTSYCGDDHCINGVDFATAIKRNPPMRIDAMAFGWQGRTYGKFCRFWITYNSQTDAVTVSRKHPEKTYPPDWE